GSGQIISLAFDYNAPPFSEPPGVEAFWEWLLKAEGQSPRHAEARYEAYRRHDEKLQTLLTNLSSRGAPLIRLLAIFLSVYILSLGGFIRWVGRNERKSKWGERGSAGAEPSHAPSRAYWIGGSLITVLFSSAVIIPRHFVPSSVSVNRFSILSVYAERERAHLQTYLGIIASANSETSIQFKGGAFIKPLTPTATPPLQLVQGKDFQLRRAALDAWVTRTYFAESFIDFPSHLSPGPSPPAPLPSRAQRVPSFERGEGGRGGEGGTKQIQHHLPDTLENAWLIDGGKYTYLGAIAPDTTVEIKAMPPPEGVLPFPQELSGTRRQFAQILMGESVLRYLIPEQTPKLVGWLRGSFLSMELNHPINAGDETFVILYLAN
ncbi:hypothetical protein HYR99_25680, partial [Candidatus Poribacteria bacterium]|nr:hypothetical protein [Candidatus Poribacteria bacterium]